MSRRRPLSVDPRSRRAAGPRRPRTAVPRSRRGRWSTGAARALESVRLEAVETVPPRSREVDLSVDLVPVAGLVLANPILVASGTFGYGVEYGDVVDVQRLGAICCKGTTLKPRIGNPTPRVTETPGGMLELDRPAEPGRGRGHREVRAALAGVAGAGDRQRRRRVGRGLRRGRPTARRRARRRRDRAEHLVPERRQGRPPVRDRRVGGRRGHGGRPPGDGPAAAREALAERGRRATDREGDRGGRRRRADRGQHAVGDRRRSVASPAVPRQHVRRGVGAGDQADRPAGRLRGRAGRVDPDRRDRRRRGARRRAGLPRRRRGRGPGGHGDLRRPDAAGAADRRAGGRVPAPRPRVLPAAHRDGAAGPDRRARRRRESNTGPETAGRLGAATTP